ncbi:GNAT family acetyltransferase [Achlya hypogyna]|uniref:GNAT family acetyltransferase n=1 Tax=Achlya hypogyna TaxID=1202772 RepID=A0A1V9YTS4_ACHHY|nr:GNAT family acetyltransferase [Achlya hypogyna]
MTVTWTCKPFAALSARGIYDILHARNAVFVYEQRCVWLEVDNLDKAPSCLHLVGTASDGESIAGYARLLGPGTKGEAQTYPVISRVLTTASHRGTGLGRQVMLEAIAECGRQWPGQNILINAQAYLEPFYKSLGFVQISDLYDEDGIMHMDMLRAPTKTQ